MALDTMKEVENDSVAARETTSVIHLLSQHGLQKVARDVLVLKKMNVKVHVREGSQVGLPKYAIVHTSKVTTVRRKVKAMTRGRMTHAIVKQVMRHDRTRLPTA